MTDRGIMRQACVFWEGSASANMRFDDRQRITLERSTPTPTLSNTPPESDGTESGGVFLSSEAETSLYRLFMEIAPNYGYKVREEQIRFAVETFKTIKKRGILLSDVGLGIGKTDAYLAAAILAKRSGINDFGIGGKCRDKTGVQLPVVISTSSIALQNAVAGDYIPRLSKMMTERRLINKPISCAVRKGKEHYLCIYRLCSYMEAAPEAELRQLAPLTRAN